MNDKMDALIERLLAACEQRALYECLPKEAILRIFVETIESGVQKLLQKEVH